MVNRKRAFTLVELLVVIAIIGVLVALLLPAIQAAREAARRTDCANRLRQLGLACQTYHDANQKFPSASAVEASALAPKGTMLSWVAQILPFMEQRSLHSLVNHKQHWDDPQNEVAEHTPLPSFRCPTQDAIEPTYTDPIGGSGTEELSNLRITYHGCMGAKWYTSACPPAGTVGSPGNTYDIIGDCSSSSYGGTAMNGLIVHPRDVAGGIATYEKVNMKGVTDGTTKTILIGELSWDAGAQRVWIVGSASRGVHQSYSYTTKNVMWPLNTATRALQGMPASGYNNNDMSFGSKHPGGCHVAMGDASVQFVRQEVPVEILKSLASRGSEETSESPF